MTTSTRRISFYLKPATVKSERKACDYLDSLQGSERSRAQRAAFLAGLALIQRDPAQAYWLSEWPEGEFHMASAQAPREAHRPPAPEDTVTTQMKKNIRILFPE